MIIFVTAIVIVTAIHAKVVIVIATAIKVIIKSL